jgi:hypothetical protein
VVHDRPERKEPPSGQHSGHRGSQRSESPGESAGRGCRHTAIIERAAPPYIPAIR